MAFPMEKANVRVSIPVRSLSDSDLFSRNIIRSEDLCFVVDPAMHKDSVARAALHATGCGLHQGETEFYASVTRVGAVSLSQLANAQAVRLCSVLDLR